MWWLFLAWGTDMRLLAILFLLPLTALAQQQQPTPQQQVEILKAELQATREQRESAMSQIASLSVALRSLDAALAEAKKNECKPEEKKK